MQEITTQNDFDYSLVDFETQEFLQERSNIIYGIQSKSAYEIGKQLVKAQEVLAKNRYGCFEEWYSSLGFRKTKAYEYINHYNFIRSQSEQLNIETFEELPKKLQSEMSKPSANPELNQKVFDGDITTHKQYKELERQLKLAEADKERLKQQNERLAEQALSAKVVEKEVVIEKVPDDYNYFKSNYEASKGVQEFYKKQNEELREEMKELEKIIKAQRNNSASQSELQKLEDKKAILTSEIESLDKIANFQEAVETFISDNASLSYTKDFENLYTNREITLSLLDTFNRLEKWIENTKTLLPDCNIIEGE